VQLTVVPDLGIEREDLLMCVVDVLRHDIENVSSTVNLLNNRGSIGWREFSRRDFSEADGIGALKELVKLEMVRVLKEDERTHQLSPWHKIDVDDRDIQSLWFELTRKARQTWDRWTPPTGDTT
jgi:hypothetical protein